LGGFDSDVDESQGIDLHDFDLDIDKFLCIDLGDFDSEAHEYDYMNKRMQDISIVEVRNDKGIQGIPKERGTITRETTRQRRLQRYKNYENIPQSGEI